MNAEARLVAHVLGHDYADLPAPVREAAKVFILDAAGVGIAGSRHPRMPQVHQALSFLGAGVGGTGAATATVWGSGGRAPWESAVLLNAYQVFNQEFDCIHDRAVIHAMACLLPACLGYAQASGGVSGRQLIAAVTLGLDVAIYVGLAQRAPMAFFRPAMCGALGATAAVAKLAGLNGSRMLDALGLACSHLSGTMQAHVEGSPAVGMQVGFNARAAVTACALAAAGFPGPHDFLEGQFGYFALFDFGQADWAGVESDIGRIFQIARMSHKPYPTGRATHGGIEGVLRLMGEHHFSAEDVERVTVHASALVVRLVGRAAAPDMDPGHARLCMAYAVAAALQTGRVGLKEFEPSALRDPARLDLASRVCVVDNGNPDPNAIGGPQTVEVRLKDGTRHSVQLEELLGHPSRPLPASEQELKFDECCAFAARPLSPAQARGLREQLRRLEDCEDVSSLVRQFHGNTD
jgi:aconitate decarboxylase